MRTPVGFDCSDSTDQAFQALPQVTSTAALERTCESCRSLEQPDDLVCRRLQLGRRRQRSAASTGYQSRRPRSSRPAVSNGSIARSMRASSACRAGSVAAPRRPSAAHAASSGPNVGCARSRNPGARSGAPEPARGFAEAGGREIEQAEPLEQRRIRHRRVQRRDEPFGRVQLGQRRRARTSRSAASRSRPGACAPAVDQPQDAEQRQRKPGREQRIDHAGGRRQQRPARPATRALRNASRGAWTNGSTARASRNCSRDRRQRREQALPGRRAVGCADRGGRRIGQRRAGAGDAVVEAQHPDPAAGKHVMQRRIVDRIGRRLGGGRRRSQRSTPSKCV